MLFLLRCNQSQLLCWSISGSFFTGFLAILTAFLVDPGFDWFLLLSLPWVGVFVEIKVPTLHVVASLLSSAYPLVKRPVPCHAQIVKPKMWEPCPREECMKPLHKVLWSERPSSAARKDQIQVLPSDASLQSIFRLA